MLHLRIILFYVVENKDDQQKGVLKYAPKKYNFWTITCAIKRKPPNLFWWGGTINIAEGFFGVCISNDTTLCNENCKRKSLNLIWWIMCLQMMKATESNWSQWRMESKGLSLMETFQAGKSAKGYFEMHIHKKFWTISSPIKRKTLSLLWWGCTIGMAEGFFKVLHLKMILFHVAKTLREKL